MADRLSSETNNSAYLVSRLNRAQAENDALLASDYRAGEIDTDAIDARAARAGVTIVIGLPLVIAATFGLLIWGGHAGVVWAGDLLSRLFS